jgi:hypothetical protein
MDDLVLMDGKKNSLCIQVLYFSLFSRPGLPGMNGQAGLPGLPGGKVIE